MLPDYVNAHKVEFVPDYRCDHNFLSRTDDGPGAEYSLMYEFRLCAGMQEKLEGLPVSVYILDRDLRDLHLATEDTEHVRPREESMALAFIALGYLPPAELCMKIEHRTPEMLESLRLRIEHHKSKINAIKLLTLGPNGL